MWGGVDIIVLIFGCLFDLILSNVIKFDKVNILVFDEVDCMLSLGFIEEFVELLVFMFVKK